VILLFVVIGLSAMHFIYVIKTNKNNY